jgi:hypothetical protein
MTPDERNLLQTFLSDLAQAPASAKDPEAERMIQDAMRANPNAAYLLVQHAILSDQALHAAQAQLEAQSQSPPQAGFLQPNAGAGYGYQAAPQGGAPWAGQGGQPVQSSPFGASSGLGGFLRSAGTMAAGVAAGDFLAQGIENIFSPRW